MQIGDKLKLNTKENPVFEVCGIYPAGQGNQKTNLYEVSYLSIKFKMEESILLTIFQKDEKETILVSPEMEKQIEESIKESINKSVAKEEAAKEEVDLEPSKKRGRPSKTESDSVSQGE